MKAGVQGEIIEKLGHWESDTYKRYIHCSVQDITKAQLSYAALTDESAGTYK